MLGGGTWFGVILSRVQLPAKKNRKPRLRGIRSFLLLVAAKSEEDETYHETHSGDGTGLHIQKSQRVATHVVRGVWSRDADGNFGRGGERG